MGAVVELAGWRSVWCREQGLVGMRGWMAQRAGASWRRAFASRKSHCLSCCLEAGCPGQRRRVVRLPGHRWRWTRWSQRCPGPHPRCRSPRRHRHFGMGCLSAVRIGRSHRPRRHRSGVTPQARRARRANRPVRFTELGRCASRFQAPGGYGAGEGHLIHIRNDMVWL